MIVIAYASVLALVFALATALSYGQQTGDLTFAQGTLLAEAVLIHIPAALTVARLRKLASLTVTQLKYPDPVFPALAGIFWIQLAVFESAGWQVVLGGLMAVLAIAVGAAGVRALGIVGNALNRTTVFYSDTGAGQVLNVAKTHIYLLRIAAVALSMALAIAAVLQREANVANVGLITLALIAAIAVLTMASAKQAQTLAAQVKATAKQRVAHELAQSRCSAAIYVSDPRAVKYQSASGLIKKLVADGVPVTAIVRDQGGVNPAKSAGAEPTYFAPTIGTLDNFANPQLEAVFYVNDAEKNGHFTRFSEFVHVLVPSGRLALEPALPKGASMYDVVVAPSHAKAKEWVAALDDTATVQIATVGTHSSGQAPRARTDPSDACQLAVFVDAEDPASASAQNLNAIAAIAQEASDLTNMSLTVVVGVGHAISDALFHRIAKRLEPENRPALEVVQGPREFAEGIADVVISASDERLENAIYLDPASAPDGAEIYRPGDLAETVETVLERLSERVSLVPHYRDFCALVLALKAEADK